MPSEWIIVLIVGLLLLFSAKKLPDMARGLGQSMRIFKAETRGLKDDEQQRKAAADPAPAIGESAPGRAATTEPAPVQDTTTDTARPGTSSS